MFQKETSLSKVYKIFYKVNSLIYYFSIGLLKLIENIYGIKVGSVNIFINFASDKY